MDLGREIRKGRKKMSHVAVMKFGRIRAAPFLTNVTGSAGMDTRDGFAPNTQSFISSITSQKKAYNNEFDLTIFDRRSTQC